MEADRTESHDLSSAEPERVMKMIAQWDAWAQRSFVDKWNGPDHTDWGQDIKRASD